jgi:hypothetical protein
VLFGTNDYFHLTLPTMSYGNVHVSQSYISSAYPTTASMAHHLAAHPAVINHPLADMVPLLVAHLAVATVPLLVDLLVAVMALLVDMVQAEDSMATVLVLPLVLILSAWSS